MTLQIVFHDSEGRVRCVENGESRATVHGCEKAVSDTDTHGEITTRHTVMVEDGEVVSAELQPEPEPTAEQWLKRIQSRADRELDSGVTVTIGGVDYRVATTAAARALIAGAKIRAEEAIASGTSTTRKIPTDKGIKAVNETQLVTLFDLVESHHQAIMDRIEELEGLVDAGTITTEGVETGWP